MQITDIDIHVQAEKEGQTGNVEVIMHCDTREKGFLCAQLLSEEGQEEDRIFPVPTEGEIDFCMQVSPVRLWDVERAYLYDLVLELRDEKMRLLGCTVKKIAFRRVEREQEKLWLNGQCVFLRPWHCTEKELRETLESLQAFRCFEKKAVCSREETQSRSAGVTPARGPEMLLRYWLAAIRRGHYNALSIAWENTKVQGEQLDRWQAMLAELCPEYGLYYDEEAKSEGVTAAPPGASFELNVTQEGVLLENRCSFINASEYELRYAIFRDGKTICKGSMCVDVPPKSGRYIELPFTVLQEAGEYIYRVSLHLKRDMPWAANGYEIAAGESLISNLFSA